MLKIKNLFCLTAGISGIIFLLNGCAMVDLAVGTGKVALTVAKTAGKAVVKVAQMPSRRKIVKLEKEGNTLLVNAIFNRKVKAKLIVDTGCTHTQISKRIAEELGIDVDKCKDVTCTLADGSTMTAKAVTIKELRIGAMTANNVDAVVVENNIRGHDGLLGMSFLNNFVFKVDVEKEELVLEKRI